MMPNESRRVASDACDVCIVGAGASGAVLAKELGEAGLRVVVLESGGTPDPARIATLRDDWELAPYTYAPRDDGLGISVASDGAPFRITRFRGVGGSTMRYEGFSTRMHPADLRRHTEYGVGADWPLAYEELVPLYDRVETFLRLSGANDNVLGPPRGDYPMPAVPMSRAVRTMAQGAHALGLHPAHAPLAVITRSWQGRHPCNACGACWSGCAVGAISNAGVTYVPVARAAGVEFRTGCTVSRVLMRHGRAVGVEYFDAGATIQRQRARVVAVCGNAIETARLLLLSAQPGWPDGLANSSGLVGRNFVGHTVVTGDGMVDTRVDGFMGPNINGMLQDHYRTELRRGFVGGYLIALRNGELGPVHFHQKWQSADAPFGRELYRRMDAEFGHSLNLAAFGEQIPHVDNRVTLDPDVTDSLGLPVARVRTVLSENDVRLQSHAASTLRTILEASGAHAIRIEAKPSVMGNHLLGTARMGHDPTTSVADPFGRTHDVPNLFIADGSLFPTATPANPTLTIQAMATRVAWNIARTLRE